MDTLFKQLRKERKRQKLTQTELSEKSGVSQGDISDIERERVDPRSSTILRIALALNVDLIPVPRAHKNQVLNLIRDESEAVQDLTLIERYGVSDDEPE